MTDQTQFRDLPGLKLSVLDAAGPCACCGKPLLQPPAHPMFFLATVEQAIWDAAAIQRQAGLGMMAGSPALARVMGPDEDLARVINRPRRVALHFDCGMRLAGIMDLLPNDKPGDAVTAGEIAADD